MNRKDPEKILEFFRELRGCLLIVEGKKDTKALNTLELTNILAINGRPLISIAEMVTKMRGYSDIIILTDFDREGRRIASTLSRLLRAHKIHPNQRLRSCIMKFGFSKIEEFKMETILKMKKQTRKARPSGGRFKKRGDVYVKTGSNVNKIRCKGNYKSKRCSGEAGYHRSGVRPD